MDKVVGEFLRDLIWDHPKRRVRIAPSHRMSKELKNYFDEMIRAHIPAPYHCLCSPIMKVLFIMIRNSPQQVVEYPMVAVQQQPATAEARHSLQPTAI